MNYQILFYLFNISCLCLLRIFMKCSKFKMPVKKDLGYYPLSTYFFMSTECKKAKKMQRLLQKHQSHFNLLCTFKDIYFSSNILIIKCGMTILFYQVYLNVDVVIVIMIQMIKNRKFIIYLKFFDYYVTNLYIRCSNTNCYEAKLLSLLQLN